MDEPAQSHLKPPELMGDVTVAHFLEAAGADERWRVTFSGQIHFLTDRATAQRIHALAATGPVARTYEAVYAAYRGQAGVGAEPIAQFVGWCETHRGRLEQLAATPDGHALRLRFGLLSGSTCEWIGRRLEWLFVRSRMTVLWTLSLAILVPYFLRSHPPVSGFWTAAALAFLGVLIHELGHITACVRHRARQGGIGVGLYWIWPAFFADVRGSWTLTARDRLQVSLGGLYFQSIYISVLAVIAMVTADATMGMAIGISMLLMATTLNPVLKYDGYWILSDLLNVTNLHFRIAAHLRSLFRSRPDERRRLLCSRWTLVSVVFALVAIAYMGFVFEMLLRTGTSTLMQISGTWTQMHLPAVHGQVMREDWFKGCTKLASLVLQIAFISAGLVILGIRSLRATLPLVSPTSKAI